MSADIRLVHRSQPVSPIEAGAWAKELQAYRQDRAKREELARETQWVRREVTIRVLLWRLKRLYWRACAWVLGCPW